MKHFKLSHFARSRLAGKIKWTWLARITTSALLSFLLTFSPVMPALVPGTPLFEILKPSNWVGLITSRASTVTWTGVGDDFRWSTPENWSTKAVPGPDDIATFDDTSVKDVVIPYETSVSGIYIDSGYTGVLTVAASQPLTIGTDGFIQKGGNWQGGLAPMAVLGSIKIQSGSFTAPKAELKIKGNLAILTDKFYHGSGTVILDGIEQVVFGSAEFFHFHKRAPVAQTLILQSGSLLVFKGDLALEGSELGPLTVEASKKGEPATIYPQGLAMVKDVHLRDVMNTSPAVIDCTGDCAAAGQVTGFNVPNTTPDVGETPDVSGKTSGVREVPGEALGAILGDYDAPTLPTREGVAKALNSLISSVQVAQSGSVNNENVSGAGATPDVNGKTSSVEKAPVMEKVSLRTSPADISADGTINFTADQNAAFTIKIRQDSNEVLVEPVVPEPVVANTSDELSSNTSDVNEELFSFLGLDGSRVSDQGERQSQDGQNEVEKQTAVSFHNQPRLLASGVSSAYVDQDRQRQNSHTEEQAENHKIVGIDVHSNDYSLTKNTLFIASIISHFVPTALAQETPSITSDVSHSDTSDVAAANLSPVSPSSVTSAKVISPDGQEAANIEVTVAEAEGTAAVHLKKPASGFRPGKYTLQINVNTPDVLLDNTSGVGNGSPSVSVNQDFTWGVLAMNLDKSSYEIGEPVNFGMGVLDDFGRTICDAKLTLEVTPAGKTPGVNKETSGVEEAGVTTSPDCGGTTHTVNPDYAASFIPEAAGTYEVLLTAETKNGQRQMRQRFEVYNPGTTPDVVPDTTSGVVPGSQPPFVTTRSSATRLYPPTAYTMSITLKANQDFTGDIIEPVPDGFEITNISNNGQVVVSSNTPDVLLDNSSGVDAGAGGPTDPEVVSSDLQAATNAVENQKTAQNAVFGDIIQRDLPEVVVCDPSVANSDCASNTINKNQDGSVAGIESEILPSPSLSPEPTVLPSVEPSSEMNDQTPNPNTQSNPNNSNDQIKPTTTVENNPSAAADTRSLENTPDVSGDSSGVEVGPSIVWPKVSLKSGDSITLEYTYDAPDLSPQFYLLGPLRLVTSSEDTPDVSRDSSGVEGGSDLLALTAFPSVSGILKEGNVSQEQNDHSQSKSYDNLCVGGCKINHTAERLNLTESTKKNIPIIRLFSNKILSIGVNGGEKTGVIKTAANQPAEILTNNSASDSFQAVSSFISLIISHFIPTALAQENTPDVSGDSSGVEFSPSPSPTPPDKGEQEGVSPSSSPNPDYGLLVTDYSWIEPRAWQLAADATFNDAATGNWNIGTTWGGACESSCTEGTDYPGTSDTVTIDSHTVTLTANHKVNDFSLATGGTLSGSSFRLEVGGAWNNTGGTFTSSTSTVVLNSAAEENLVSGDDSFNNLIINNGLVGYWKFDEGTGSTAYDSSGYGNDGTLPSGGASPKWTTTVPTLSYTNPYALDFDGSNDYVTLGSGTYKYSNSQNWTFSGWVKRDTTSNYHNIFGGSTAGSNTRFFGNISDGDYLILYDDSEGLVGWDGTGFALGSFYHVVIQRINTTQLKLYINGVSKGTGDTASSGTHTIDKIGANGNSAYVWDGMLDDVRIYDHALTEQEVNSLAAGSISPTGSGKQVLTANLDVNGDLTLNDGELDVSDQNYSINVAGAWENNGALFTKRSGTVTFDGTSGSHELQIGGQQFNNLTISGSGGTWTLNDDLDVDGTYTQSNGTLNTSTSNYEVHANDFDQTAGTFTPNSSRLTIDSSSNQTVQAASSLYDLTTEDPTENGLVGYWKFDEGQGTTAADSSGSGNHGTLTNSPKWSQTVTSTISFDNPYSLAFDGTDDYVDVGNTSQANVKTISFWLNADDVTTRELINFDDTDEIEIDGSSNITAESFPGTTVIYVNGSSASAAVTADTWHHIAITDTTGVNASNFDIGKTDGTNYFDGQIDDVRVYNRALSGTEVETLSQGRYADGDNSTATFTLGAALDADNDVILQSGILDVSAAPYAVTVGGDWRNWSGNSAFTGRSGTVTLNGGTQTVYGATTFNNLTKNTAGTTLNFEHSQTQTVSGTLTLDGSAGNNLTVRSTNPTTRFTIDSTGAVQKFTYVDVQDANASSNVMVCYRCTNSGNTDHPDATPHWDFRNRAISMEPPRRFLV